MCPRRPPDYFEGDKVYRTDDITRTDSPAIMMGLLIGRVEVFLQADILNVFDEARHCRPLFGRLYRLHQP